MTATTGLLHKDSPGSAANIASRSIDTYRRYVKRVEQTTPCAKEFPANHYSVH